MPRMPLLKTAVFEGLAGLSVLGLTFTIGTAELTLILSAITVLVGMVVWLVRLEGRINMLVQQAEQQQKTLDKMDTRLDKIAEHFEGSREGSR